MWLYQGKAFTNADINDLYGFVYLITDIDTGRKYIGRKAFFIRKTLPPLKGKTRKRKLATESDWQSYHGSNAALKELVAIHGSERFMREILHLCRSSSECAYYEAKTQFEHDAIIGDDYFNDWIMCRVSRSHVKSLKSLNTTVIEKETNDHETRKIC